ncbi:hypothetical protein K8R03_04790 [Candidatus Kaiserbacteria bacterium]|nr:hypothetical protein [Candidatus Kaiserbacteria bacterium]
MKNKKDKASASKEEQERTTVQKALFLESFARTYGYASGVCKSLGMGRSTYHYWRKEDPVFNQAILDIQKDRIYDVEDSMYIQAIVKEKVAAGKYILSHKHPDYKDNKKKFSRYGEVPLPFDVEPTIVDIIRAQEIVSWNDEQQRLKSKDSTEAKVRKQTQEYHKTFGMSESGQIADSGESD